MKEKTTDREQKGWGPGPRGPCRALRGLSCVAAAPATRGFPSSLCKGHSQTRPGCSPHALGSQSLWGSQQGIRIKGITAHQLSLLRWVPVPERSGGGDQACFWERTLYSRSKTYTRRKSSGSDRRSAVNRLGISALPPHKSQWGKGSLLQSFPLYNRAINRKIFMGKKKKDEASSAQVGPVDITSGFLWPTPSF